MELINCFMLSKIYTNFKILMKRVLKLIEAKKNMRN